MSRLHFEEARTEEQFAALSLIHALGWRTTYRGAVPDDYMAREITDERWVPFFRADYTSGRCRGLLLYRGDTPAACCSYGAGRGQEPGCAGWGEIRSFYAHPDEKGKGYGSLLMEEALRRLRAEGYPAAYVYVLRENDGARRFYAAHGFAWDGTHTEIPFPGAVCIDLRYTRVL